jgi:hypothetical protein
MRLRDSGNPSPSMATTAISRCLLVTEPTMLRVKGQRFALSQKK